MRRMLTTAAFILAVSSFAITQNATSNKLEQELRQVEQQITEASVRGDKATLDRLIADDFLRSYQATTSTKADWLRGLPNPKYAGLLKETETLSDVQVRDYGDVALMSYISKIVAQISASEATSQWRMTDIYRRRNGQWQLAARHETSITLDAATTTSNNTITSNNNMSMDVSKDPPVAEIDLKLLDDYVGKYERRPVAGGSFVINVVRKGDKLFFYEVDPTFKHELLPENEITFFQRGSAERITFARDASGKVSKLFLRGSFGGEYKKIK